MTFIHDFRGFTGYVPVSTTKKKTVMALPTARCFWGVPTGKLRGACAATCSDATRWFGNLTQEWWIYLQDVVI